MAGRPPFDQFDAESEDIESYLERLQDFKTSRRLAYGAMAVGHALYSSANFRQSLVV